jgi:hypothetical protein
LRPASPAGSLKIACQIKHRVVPIPCWRHSSAAAFDVASSPAETFSPQDGTEFSAHDIRGIAQSRRTAAVKYLDTIRGFTGIAAEEYLPKPRAVAVQAFASEQDGSPRVMQRTLALQCGVLHKKILRNTPHCKISRHHFAYENVRITPSYFSLNIAFKNLRGEKSNVLL